MLSTSSVSLLASSASRAACSITRATPPRSSGRSPALAAIEPISPRDHRLARRRTLDIVIEVGQHLEVLRGIRIGRGQQVVQHAVAEQHDLHVERDRIRLQRHRRGHAHEPRGVLDHDLLAQQGTLQRGPALGFGEQVAQVDHDRAAIGAMQAARLDQPEIRHQRALHREVLDAADKIAQCRMHLLDHRCAGLRRPSGVTSTLTS